MTSTPTSTFTSASGSSGNRTPRLVTASVTAALLGLIVLAVAGTGYRLGWWGLPIAFRLFLAGGVVGAIAFILAIAAIFTAGRRRTSGRLAASVFALIVGAVLAGTVTHWFVTARTVPPIHDITTDTDDPPQFVTVLPLRATAKNSAVYGGPEVAAKQRLAYPDVQPITLNVPPPVAFTRSLAAAQAMGWEIVAADSAAGRIEATATTRWFGFKDDIVVRIRPQGDGSRVDVRSESRVGGSDVGTNAARIRKFATMVSAPS